MLRRVLCVDDEPNILRAFERQFRHNFEIETASSPELGLQALTENGPFAVVVSDLRMPGMDGIEFLARTKTLAPETVRVMLTGQAELITTIAAVNRGSVFQFLIKPCPTEVLRNTLEAAVEQYRLITSEQQLLEETLRRSLGVLTEVLSLCNPLAFSRAQRIRHYVRSLAERLELPDRWQYETAAMLSQIGYVAVPPQILEKSRNGERLHPEESSMISSQSKVGSELLAQIPRLDEVAQMVARQQESWNPHVRNPDRITVGAQLLKIAEDFDDAVLHGGEPEEVANNLRKRADYNPDFVEALQQIQVARDATEILLVTVRQLRTRMIVNADVLSKSGLLLLAKGQEVTGSAIVRLHNFAATIGVVEPISVIVPFGQHSSFGDLNRYRDHPEVPVSAEQRNRPAL